MKRSPLLPRLLLLILACAAPARAAEPKPLRIVPAMSAIQAGKGLVLWAPDLRSVLGVDADGKRVWRVATGDQGGLRDLELLAGNALAYAGTEALLIAPDTGKVLGSLPQVQLGGPGEPRGCRLYHEEGACALACECRFQVVACEDLSPLGEPALLPHFEESDAEGQMQSHCPMFSGALLGRSGDAVITSFPAATDKPFFSVPEITVARHAKSGAELWRSSSLGFFDEELSGVADDGTCYAGSRADTLTVFDCQRATVLWQRKLTVPKGGTPQVEATPHGYLVRDRGQVALLESKSGRPLWQVDVPAENLALIPGATPAPRAIDRRFAKTVVGARVLAADDGRTLATVRFPPGTESWPRRFGDGWIALGDKRLEAFDAAGRSLGGIGPSESSDAIADYVVGSGARLAMWDRHAVTLGALPDHGSLVALKKINDASLRVVAFEGALGPGRLAVLKDGQGPWDAKNPDTFGELRLYDVSRSAGPDR